MVMRLKINNTSYRLNAASSVNMAQKHLSCHKTISFITWRLVFVTHYLYNRLLHTAMLDTRVLTPHKLSWRCCININDDDSYLWMRVSGCLGGRTVTGIVAPRAVAADSTDKGVSWPPSDLGRVPETHSKSHHKLNWILSPATVNHQNYINKVQSIWQMSTSLFCHIHQVAALNPCWQQLPVGGTFLGKGRS